MPSGCLAPWGVREALITGHDAPGRLVRARPRTRRSASIWALAACSRRAARKARASSLKSWRASFSSSRSARRRVSKRSCNARMPAWYAGDVASLMALLLREGHRPRRLGVDVQLEQVRARVVPDDVEVAPRYS